MSRLSLLRVALATVVLAIPLVASSPVSPVELNVNGAGPRKLEPTLQQSIQRDYARAWQTLDASLENGDPSQLDQYWTGVAHDKFQRLVQDQARTGVQVRYNDKAHHLQAVFYPFDGAAMLLYDTAEVEMQVSSGGKLLHSETITQRYVVLMTPAQDRWMVRVLQQTLAS